MAVKLEKSNQHLFRLRLERRYMERKERKEDKLLIFYIIFCYIWSIILLFSSILMEKLGSIEPKLSEKATSAQIKSEILKEMEMKMEQN